MTLSTLLSLADPAALAAPNGLDTFMDHLRSLWWHPELGIVWTPETGTLELHTLGWSGNEEIISALMHTAFWWISWWRITRGGHYYLEVPAVWNSQMRKEGHS